MHPFIKMKYIIVKELKTEIMSDMETQLKLLLNLVHSRNILSYIQCKICDITCNNICKGNAFSNDSHESWENRQVFPILFTESRDQVAMSSETNQRSFSTHDEHPHEDKLTGNAHNIHAWVQSTYLQITLSHHITPNCSYNDTHYSPRLTVLS